MRRGVKRRRGGKVRSGVIKEYALILANRGKLKQVFKMFGSV